MSNIAIRVSNVKLRYRLVRKISFKKIFSKQHDRVEYFEALKGIDFEVSKGDIVGVIGKNGSGKSTLLRTIAGIFSPDEGSIELFGNKVSLMSIGVGFNNKLSGRENIYLSGLLLGFTKQYIEEKMEEIIEFSELGDFIDKPVKTYSSGMHSKLAFSITACLESDIILIDEVLSVGDAKFKKKSFKKMKELITDKDKTVIIVSHNADTIRDLCNKAIWIDKGKVIRSGETQLVLDCYEGVM